MRNPWTFTDTWVPPTCPACRVVLLPESEYSPVRVCPKCEQILIPKPKGNLP